MREWVQSMVMLLVGAVMLLTLPTSQVPGIDRGCGRTLGRREGLRAERRSTQAAWSIREMNMRIAPSHALRGLLIFPARPCARMATALILDAPTERHPAIKTPVRGN